MSDLAVSAATRVAAELGYVADDAVVLQDTNNTVVWLRPHAIVAKVGSQAHNAEALLREHSIGVSLAMSGAPIAPPLTGIPPQRDQETGFKVTFWQHFERDHHREAAGPEVSGSLRQLHAAFAQYKGHLPSFRDNLETTRRALQDDVRMAALTPADRSLLRDAYDTLVARLAGHTFVERPLHGEPHSRNMLVTDSGVKWVDFEAACTGPIEWDLACTDGACIAGFPEADPKLLDLLQLLTSARVATWCWIRTEQLPEMLRHAEYHLDVIRERFAY